MPMPSRSVQPAGKRHSHGGHVAGADDQARRLPPKDARDSGNVRPGSAADCRRRSSRQSAGALPSARDSGRGRGLCADAVACAGCWRARQAGARAATAGADARGGRGLPEPDTVAPHGGCVSTAKCVSPRPPGPGRLARSCCNSVYRLPSDVVNADRRKTHRSTTYAPFGNPQVQQLAPATADPAFHDRVHPQRLTSEANDPSASGPEHRAGRGGEGDVAIMQDQRHMVIAGGCARRCRGQSSPGRCR
jgi:hypothetical protein